MKLELKTERLKTILDKAIKASGRFVMFPKTTIVGLYYKDNTLEFTTTDRVNTLIIREKGITNLSDDTTSTYWAVSSDLLSKLVSKTTTEFVTLENNGADLIFKGNGKYTLPIILDSDATPLKIETSSLEEINFVANKTVPTENLKKILTYNKPSVAKTSDVSYLMGYHAGNDAITTFNTVTACVNYQSITDGKELLLPSSFVDLFSILDEEETTLSTQGNIIKLVSGNITLYSTLLENIEKFPSTALKNITKEDFPAKCVVDKRDLFKILDRINLFIKPTDDNSIRLSFGDKLCITSKDGAGEENLEFQSSENNIKFEECVDIQDLRSQLQVNPFNLVTLLYGNERGLMIHTDNIYQLIPFMVSEE